MPTTCQSLINAGSLLGPSPAALLQSETSLNASSESVLRFQATGIIVGAEVRLFSDGSPIGSAVAPSDVIAVPTDGATAISDGFHDITAIQIVDGVESPPSPALQINIDTVPPEPISNSLPDFPQVGEFYSFNL